MGRQSFAVLASALLYLASVVVATPVEKLQKRDYAVKSSHHTPRKWQKAGAAPPNHVLNLQIGLKQARIDDVLQHLNEVSNPKNSRYGQHLTAAEINDLVRPSDETLNLVTSWLTDYGIDAESLSYNEAADWITVKVPVHQANKLLDTDYSIYEHEEEGTMLVRTPEFSLPQYLHDHIDVIEPTNSFLRPVKKAPKSTAKFQTFETANHEDASRTLASQAASNGTGPTVCDINGVTPGCLRSYYGTLDYVPQATDKNKVAIANYLGEVNIRSDLKLYLQNFRPEAVAAADDFQLISIDGGTTNQVLNSTEISAQTGVEGGLDVQTVVGISYPTKLISYSTGGSQPGWIADNFTTTNTNEPYLAWVTYMLALSDDEIPYVVSTSYADDEQTISLDYAQRVCNSFAQLGARGVSLFFGSGDEGVGEDGDCFSNAPPYGRSFTPEFPSSCPYVTTVGATYHFNPEIAALDTRFKVPFTSGGGFSNVFPTPDYQKDAVAKYLADNNNFPAYAGWFNLSGRGYPDVAAQGVNYSIVWDGAITSVDGTSAATPAFAAIIALVNDALLAAGKSTLGFLNPWLYSGGYEAFMDVTSGSAAGCEVAGFTAGVGWDAVTGFGTPNFPKILENLGVSTKSDDNDDDDDDDDSESGYKAKRKVSYINRRLPITNAKI